MGTRARVLAVFGVLHVATALWFVLDRASGTGAAWRGLPLDDAWIHLVYARGLCRLDGFAYNEGQLEAGFTSPLWVLLLAPMVGICRGAIGSVVVGAKVVGVATGVALSWTSYRVTTAISGRTSAGVVAGMLVALDPSLCFSQVSGMEVLLSPTCTLAAVSGLAEQRWWLVALGLGLGVLARPENVLVVGVFAVLLAIGFRRGRWPARVQWSLAAPAFAAAAWATHCVAVSGRLLPNTFVKVQVQTAAAGVANLSTVANALIHLPAFVGGVGIAFAVIGLASALHSTHHGTRSAAAALGIYPFVLLIGVAVSRALPEWQPFYWNRYLQPGWPPLFLLAAIGVDRTIRWSVARRPGLRPRGVLLRLAVLPLCGAPLVRVLPELSEKAARYSWNCQNIDEMQVALGRWLKARTAPREVVASVDAGAIRFVSDRRVIDLLGLNDHRVLTQGIGRVLVDERPRFLVVFPGWFPRATSSPRFRVVRRIRAEPYTICDCPQDEIVVLEPTRGLAVTSALP